jgi:hypothetical protein
MRRKVLVLAGSGLGLIAALGLTQPADAAIATRSRYADVCVYPMNRPPGVCVNLPDRLPLD